MSDAPVHDVGRWQPAHAKDNQSELRILPRPHCRASTIARRRRVAAWINAQVAAVDAQWQPTHLLPVAALALGRGER